MGGSSALFSACENDRLEVLQETECGGLGSADVCGLKAE